MTVVGEPQGRATPSKPPLGTLEGIYVAPTAAAPLRSVASARAEPRRGLQGDRYFERVGTYSNRPGGGRELTMIAAETLEALAEAGLPLPDGASRRNLVTRGVALDELIGKAVWVGDVLCDVVRDCPPCAHLESLTQPGVLDALVGRGGIRLEIRDGGTLRVGDAIRLAD